MLSAIPSDPNDTALRGKSRLPTLPDLPITETIDEVIVYHDFDSQPRCWAGCAFPSIPPSPLADESLVASWVGLELHHNLLA